MRSYVIVAPHLIPTSAGVSALHLLSDHLNAAGVTSRVISIWDEQVNPLNIGDQQPPTDNEITLYPDCFIGNPFKAKRVVRCLFMTAGYFGQDKTFPPEEYMYYYMPEFVVEGRNPDNILSVPMIKEERFPYKSEGRSGSCYLATKLVDYFQLPLPDKLPPDCVRITKDMDLAKLFAEKQKLITYDNSAINLEALLCGMEVDFRFNEKFPYLFTFGGYFDYAKPRESYAAMKLLYFSQQLPAFIKRTQEHFK